MKSVRFSAIPIQVTYMPMNFLVRRWLNSLGMRLVDAEDLKTTKFKKLYEALRSTARKETSDWPKNFILTEVLLSSLIARDIEPHLLELHATHFQYEAVDAGVLQL